MKIIIDNVPFDYEMGLKICIAGGIQIEGLDINQEDTLTFMDIAMLDNLEQRRIAILYFGTERLLKEVEPTLVSKEVINKTTECVIDGMLTTINYQDTYELYKVSGEKLFGKQPYAVKDEYYVKCKDTSTNRDYIIWVDISSVLRANGKSEWNFSRGDEKIDAIECIAWTIKTNVPKDEIEYIVRQGDCVFIKTKNEDYQKDWERHLSKEEYINLLKIES